MEKHSWKKEAQSIYKTRKNYMFGLKLAQVCFGPHTFFFPNTIPLFSYDLVLVENFIFIILKSLILRDEKENCWKITKERNSLIGNISATKKWLLISMSFIRWGEFYLRVFSSLFYLKSRLGLRNIFFFQFDFVFLDEFSVFLVDYLVYWYHRDIY